MGQPKEIINATLAQTFGITPVEGSKLRKREGYVCKQTTTDDFRALIQRLHPVHCRQSPLVRFGPPDDGGYLVPDDLDGIVACFSPGVSDESGFELQCAERGMQVFMADKSVDGPAGEHERYHFIKKFIGATTGGDLISMDDWIEESMPGSQEDLLLQMDIEGAEYEALAAMSRENLKRFRIIVIEFHELQELWSSHFFRLASITFDKLLSTHACVHIHPNNCRPVESRNGLEYTPLAEFTFYRRDRIKQPVPANAFPHPLDADCTDRGHIVLPATWYR